MSALAEALVAAQRRALSAMEKQYAAGKLSDEAAQKIMNSLGLTDDVDQDRLIYALDVIRQYGATLPAEASNGTTAVPEKITDAQAAFIDDLWQRRGGKPGDKPVLTGLSKPDASRLIEQLKTDTYNVSEWEIPF